MRLVLALGDRQTPVHLGKGQSDDEGFQRTRQSGDDDKLAPTRFDRPCHFVVEDPRICAHPYLTQRGGQLLEAGPQQPDGPGGGMHVARAEFAVPKVPGLPLEADQRMVRGPAALPRIVASTRLLLMAVQGQDRRVQIEQHPPQRPRALTQLGEQAVVQAPEPGQSANGEALEKTPQRRGIGICRQPCERLEDAVALQQLGGLDPSQPQDDWVEQREQHLGNRISVVALGKANLLVETLAQMQALEKAVEQKHAAIPRQMVAGERNPDPPRSPAMTHRGLPEERDLPFPDNYTVVRLSGMTQNPLVTRSKSRARRLYA